MEKGDPSCDPLKQVKFFKLMDVTATFRAVVNQARTEQGLENSIDS